MGKAKSRPVDLTFLVEAEPEQPRWMFLGPQPVVGVALLHALKENA